MRGAWDIYAQDIGKQRVSLGQLIPQRIHLVGCPVILALAFAKLGAQPLVLAALPLKLAAFVVDFFGLRAGVADHRFE
ncbi:hypothetical protein D3C85_1628390 [compost metagenome]